jgi:hypothetical protein
MVPQRFEDMNAGRVNLKKQLIGALRDFSLQPISTHIRQLRENERRGRSAGADERAGAWRY